MNILIFDVQGFDCIQSDKLTVRSTGCNTKLATADSRIDIV